MPSFGPIGPLELIIVLAIALLLLGPKRLPELGSAVGKTIREFRKAAADVQEEASLDRPAQPATAPSSSARPSSAAAETNPSASDSSDRSG